MASSTPVKDTPDLFRTRRDSIECVCGEKHKFADLEKIIVQHYQRPYGCTGGDYWYDAEWNYICPTLNKRVRILFTGNYALGIRFQQADEIKEAFQRLYRDGWKSERREERTDRGVLGRDFYNNSAVDKDPFAYGLARTVTVAETHLEIA